MDPSSRSRARPRTSCSPHHHHHHHPQPHHHHHHHHHPLIIFPRHHHLFLCPHHHHHHHHHHSHLNCHCHVSASPAPLHPPPNLQQVGAAPLQNESALFKDATHQYHGTQMLQEKEHWGLEEAEEDDDYDDEPIFVLTDEWREFFAKSEAKRKLEKKQAKRK